MRQIKVLFYVDSGTMVSHCVTAAELIRKQLGAHVIMMLISSKKYVNETMKNYEVYDYSTLFVPTQVEQAWRPRLGLQTRLRRYIAEKKQSGSKSARIIFGLPFYILIIAGRFMVYVRRTRVSQLSQRVLRLLRGARGVDRFLRAVEPDIIFLPEDNIETLAPIFVAKGRALGVPSIVIPFTIPNPLEPARFYFNSPLHQAKGSFARLLTKYHPKWQLEYEGKVLLRQPAIVALIQERMGLSSPAPWILNRGDAVGIALDSEAQRDLYLKLGFPPAQLRIIGDLNGEMFHRSASNKARLLEEIYARHHLRPGRPLILCAFPPDQFEGTDNSNSEFSNYDELVRSWLESFGALGERANILIRPHPRTPLDRFAGFEGSNIAFTLQPTAELIPLCDLYVASISATIRWAIAGGIPTVNYDTYRYRYADFEAAAGVINVEDLDDFRTVISRFVDDRGFAEDLAERQRGVMKYWGQLDDKAGARLSDLVVEAVTEAGRVKQD